MRRKSLNSHMTNNFYNEHFHPKKIVPEMESWLERTPFTHFVTLAFNRTETIDSARNKLKHFHARLDRKILGSNWYKKAKEERTFFLAFPEHIHSNFHYHLLTVVKNENECRFNNSVEDAWKSIVKSGSVNIQSFRKSYNPEGFVSYSLKEQYSSKNYQSFVISHEFLSL